MLDKTSELSNFNNTNNNNSVSLLEADCSKMPLINLIDSNSNNNNSSMSFIEDEEPNINSSFNKLLDVDSTEALGGKLNNRSSKLIDSDHESVTNSQTYIDELEDKIKQLEHKNKNLQSTLEALYEKDDVFMASSRRENEERENFIKLLQNDIEQITNEK